MWSEIAMHIDIWKIFYGKKMPSGKTGAWKTRKSWYRHMSRCMTEHTSSKDQMLMLTGKCSSENRYSKPTWKSTWKNSLGYLTLYHFIGCIRSGLMMLVEYSYDRYREYEWT